MRCVLLARKICFLRVRHNKNGRKGFVINDDLAGITKFMPAYNLTTIYDIQYGLLKFRNLQLDGNFPSIKMFHFNNLLTKDKLDGDTDPYLIKVMGTKAKG